LIFVGTLITLSPFYIDHKFISPWNLHIWIKTSCEFFYKKIVNFVAYDIISFFHISFETWYKGFLDLLILFKQVKILYGFILIFIISKKLCVQILFTSLFITNLRCLKKCNSSQQKHVFIGTFWICSSYVSTSLGSYVF
jgi:hypothetical protein